MSRKCLGSVCKGFIGQVLGQRAPHTAHPTITHARTPAARARAPPPTCLIWQVLGEPDPVRRQWGNAATVCAAVVGGADLVRVHEVAEMRQVRRARPRPISPRLPIRLHISLYLPPSIQVAMLADAVHRGGPTGGPAARL